MTTHIRPNQGAQTASERKIAFCGDVGGKTNPDRRCTQAAELDAFDLHRVVTARQPLQGLRQLGRNIVHAF